MAISTQLITANTHLSLPFEVWRERVIPLLAFSEIVSVLFQTCHFLRAYRFQILTPMAAAEQEQMQITPYQGLDLPLERIVSVWLTLPSASLRAIRSSFAAQPPIIYLSQFANASVLINEQILVLHGENGLLSPRAPPPGSAYPNVFTLGTNLATNALIDAEESIPRACLIARTILPPDRAAECFARIAFRGDLLWGYSRNIPSESQVWEQAQVVMNHVPNVLRDLVYFHLARSSSNSGGKQALRYANLIKDSDLREKILGEIVESE